MPRTRLFKSTAAKIRIGDFAAQSVVNESTAWATWHGVVESITPLGGTFDIRDVHFSNGTWVTLCADDVVWIERTYV